MFYFWWEQKLMASKTFSDYRFHPIKKKSLSVSEQKELSTKQLLVYKNYIGPGWNEITKHNYFSKFDF